MKVLISFILWVCPITNHEINIPELGELGHREIAREIKNSGIDIVILNMLDRNARFDESTVEDINKYRKLFLKYQKPNQIRIAMTFPTYKRDVITGERYNDKPTIIFALNNQASYRKVLIHEFVHALDNVLNNIHHENYVLEDYFSRKTYEWRRLEEGLQIYYTPLLDADVEKIKLKQRAILEQELAISEQVFNTVSAEVCAHTYTLLNNKKLGLSARDLDEDYESIREYRKELKQELDRGQHILDIAQTPFGQLDNGNLDISFPEDRVVVLKESLDKSVKLLPKIDQLLKYKWKHVEDEDGKISENCIKLHKIKFDASICNVSRLSLMNKYIKEGRYEISYDGLLFEVIGTMIGDKVLWDSDKNLESWRLRITNE
jgi:hypothetical protein